MNKRYLSTVITCLLGATLANPTAWAAGTNSRVSVSSAGLQANGDSRHPVLSANGRIVAFTSAASNLVPGDANGVEDVFVHNRDTGNTTRVSVSSQGVEANGASGGFGIGISADGRYIAFGSDATNLVDKPTDPYGEIFVHDLTTRQTTRVSVGSQGEDICSHCGSPAISADGRYVVFLNGYGNPQGMLMFDRNTGQISQVGLDEGGRVADTDVWNERYAISADGHFVAFPVHGGIYFRDVWAGQSRLIVSNSVYPSMSADGRYVVGGVGGGWAGDGIWLFDTQTQGTEVITAGTRANIGVISAEGRHVAFIDRSNDVFVYDRQTKTTDPCSVDASGNYGNTNDWHADYYVSRPAISSDGSVVAWGSTASNLVPNDTNNTRDIIVRDRSVDEIPIDVDEIPIDSASIIPTLTVRPKAKTSGKTGKYLKYSIQIRNSSGTPTQNTVLVAKVSRNDVSIRAPHACSYAYPRLTCALGNIKPGKKKKIQIKEKAAAPGLLENTLWVETDTETGRKYSSRVTHSAMIK